MMAATTTIVAAGLSAVAPVIAAILPSGRNGLDLGAIRGFASGAFGRTLMYEGIEEPV